MSSPDVIAAANATAAATVVVGAVPVPALDLLKNSIHPIRPLGRSMLLLISNYLDNNGAGTEWSLRMVALVSGIGFLIIKLTLHKRYRVDWYGFIHSIITGVGSLVCIYLNEYVSEDLTGIAEPIRSIQYCSGSLTSLHRILPAITLGFSVLDLVDGIQMGIDFAIHGAATLAVMIYFNEISYAPGIVAPMLVLECSTIFLYLVTATAGKDSHPIVSTFVVLCFSVAFFFFRAIVFPYIHIKLMIIMYNNRTNPIYQECYPPSLLYVCGIFGAVFHSLNTFWLYKIIMKLRRKIIGLEKMNDGNEIPNHFEKKGTTGTTVTTTTNNDVDNNDKDQQQSQLNGTSTIRTTTFTSKDKNM